MSVETGSSTDGIEIFIRLLREGTEVLRPTRGIVVGSNEVQVLATSDYDPEIEIWEFPPGSTVKCEKEIKGGRELLVARKQVA
jgi:hypothetical protein